jgi:ribosome-binding protein aMBF1 (putative translation factor)
MSERQPTFHQDWDPVIMKKRNDDRKMAHAATGAQRAAGVRFSPEAERQRKLAEADGPMKQKRLAPESKQQIVNQRVANNWSQADLNMRCSFPPNTIRDIEAGKIVPNGQMLNVLNRVLKVSLRLI